IGHRLQGDHVVEGHALGGLRASGIDGEEEHRGDGETRDRAERAHWRGPKTEDRRPKTEGRRPKTEDRRPKTEDQRRKTYARRGTAANVARGGGGECEMPTGCCRRHFVFAHPYLAWWQLRLF